MVKWWKSLVNTFDSCRAFLLDGSKRNWPLFVPFSYILPSYICCLLNWKDLIGLKEPNDLDLLLPFEGSAAVALSACYVLRVAILMNVILPVSFYFFATNFGSVCLVKSLFCWLTSKTPSGDGVYFSSDKWKLLVLTGSKLFLVWAFPILHFWIASLRTLVDI